MPEAADCVPAEGHVRLVDGTVALDDTALDYRAPAQEIAIHIEAETADIAGAAVPGVSEARVEIVWEPPWTKERMSEAAKLQLGLW